MVFQKATNQLVLLAAVLSAVGIAAPQSFALPGQSVAEVERATRANPVWGGKTIKEGSIHKGSYSVSTPFRAGELVLFVGTSGSQVTGESIQLRGAGNIEFSRDGGEGLQLLRKVWGEALAQDFANSRFTDNIEDRAFRTPIKFYAGEKYGYQTISPAGFHSFSVMSLDELEQAKRNVRYCNSIPRPIECGL